MKTISEILNKSKQNKSKRLVVAAAEDTHVLQAVKQAINDNIIEAILVGDTKKIKEIAKKISLNLDNIKIIDEKLPEISCKKAINEIRRGNGDFLMKGFVPTKTLLRVVLDKKIGLRKSELLSHIAFFETKYYHKLLCITDVAMNIAPSVEEKAQIIKNAVEGCERLGIRNPKVACVAPVEFVNPKMQSTVDAAKLAKMNKNGYISNCIVEGPFGLDNAISKKAAEHKGIKSDVAGDADILLMHDINTGNVFYKSLVFFGGAVSGAVIMGAKVPIVLTSRADSEKSKLLSIVVAAGMD